MPLPKDDIECILCDHCGAVVRATNFVNHVRKVHKVELTDFNLPERVAHDKRNSKVKAWVAKLESEGFAHEKIKKASVSRQERIYLQSTPHYIIWDDIIFEKDRIRFSPTRLGIILHSVELKGSIVELNQIKEQYFK